MRWIYEGENGFWRSEEHRFNISPNYRHRTSPDSYVLTDNMGRYAKGKDGQMMSDERGRSVKVFEKWTFDTVGDCKEKAASILRKEEEKEL